MNSSSCTILEHEYHKQHI